MGLERILEGPPLPCAHEPCQQHAEWVAVAPQTMIVACSDHLGRMLHAVHEQVWFVHAFRSPEPHLVVLE